MTDRATPDDVRDEVKAWLADDWDPDLPLLDWRASWSVRMDDAVLAGGVVRARPARLGRPIVARRVRRRGAVGTPVGVGMGLAAPTILAHGSDDLKRPPAAARASPARTRGASCSASPAAGPTSPGSTTHAERDGDEWVVNGQKVWSTSAHHADLGLLLARTDWDVPKHRGITLLRAADAPARRRGPPAAADERARVVQRGVPHRCAGPGANVVGEAGRGLAGRADHARPRAAVRDGARRRLGRDAGRPCVPGGRGRGRGVLHDLLVVPAARRARRPRRASPSCTGRTDDPLVRQEMAAAASRCARAHEWTRAARPAARAAGRPPGPRVRSASSPPADIARAAARTHSLLAGADGHADRRRLPLDGVIAEVLVSVPAQSIAGGTDEIQHNILGERMLGLPASRPSTATSPTGRSRR